MNDGPKDLDVVNWLGRTTLELIGQGGFGYSFDPLVKNEPNAFGDALKAYVYVFSRSMFDANATLYHAHFQSKFHAFQPLALGN